MLRSIYLIGVVLLFLTGCQSRQSDNGQNLNTTNTNLITSTTVPVTPSPQLLTLATITKSLPTQTPPVVIPPSPTLMDTPGSTNVPMPSATPILTPVPTPSFLSEREPSFTQIDAYLRQTAIRIFFSSTGTYTVTTWDENTGEPFFLDPRTQFIYGDVNGDSEDDLLLLFAEPFMWGFNYVVVMLWQGSHYDQPLAIFERTKLPGGVSLAFEDWTGDGIVEIVWDAEWVTSGSGYGESTRTKYLVQCLSQCHVVWSYTTSVDWESHSFYLGRGVRVADVALNTEDSEIVAVTEDFMLPFTANADSISSPMYVFTTTREVFTWTGTTFELAQTEIVTPAHEITSTQKLTAQSLPGTATIEFVHVPADMGQYNEYEGFSCTVKVNSLAIENDFRCNPAFTQVWWQNIAGDSQEEIVVTTLADARAFMYIWQRQADTYHLIAAVQADVIQANLYGTRLENVDEDEAYEILAGEWSRETSSFCFSHINPDGSDVPVCWREVTRRDVVYDWDGSHFVAIPGNP